MTERFVLGLLGAPFGLKGYLKFRSSSGEHRHIRNLEQQQVTIRLAGEERLYQLENALESGPNLLLKFAGIDSPEAGRLLSGGELLGGRKDAAALAPGEFYVEDLRGMEVAALPEGGPSDPADARLEIVGAVTDILDTGGGQLLELRLLSGENRGQLRLVPFRDEFFGETSPEKNRTVLLNRWILE